jgi:hypothetical protein
VSSKRADFVGKIAASCLGRFDIHERPEMTPQIEHRMCQVLDEKQPGIDPLIRRLLG